jgi:hypothetical protein
MTAISGQYSRASETMFLNFLGMLSKVAHSITLHVKYFTALCTDSIQIYKPVFGSVVNALLVVLQLTCKAGVLGGHPRAFKIEHLLYSRSVYL